MKEKSRYQRQLDRFIEWMESETDYRLDNNGTFVQCEDGLEDFEEFRKEHWQEFSVWCDNLYGSKW